MIDTTDISSQPRPTHNPMKTKIILSLAIALTAPLLSQRIFANITYDYTGNHFTDFTPFSPYTTSDSVTAMVTLGGPLAPNMPLKKVTPIAFTLSDGVQTMTNLNSKLPLFQFATGPTGEITEWSFIAHLGSLGNFIVSDNFDGIRDRGHLENGDTGVTELLGTWATVGSVADTGATLSLMTLTLMALGLVARQFKRAAA